MRDRDIRSALRKKLAAAHETDTLIIDEMGVCQGAARVDIAVINGAINGYEIKSERDTLERLPIQQAVYSRVFDTVTIVAATEHLDRVAARVPDWWGIYLADEANGQVVLSQVRRSRENPAVDPFALAQLLWRDEALAILDQYGCADGVRRKPRKAIWERLAHVLAIDELKAHVRSALKARKNWREHA